MKNGQTIYHLEMGGEHHYFGSITAIFDVFTPEQLGVSLSRLWSFGITETHPYTNKLITIRRGVLHRKRTNRKLPTQNNEENPYKTPS